MLFTELTVPFSLITIECGGKNFHSQFSQIRSISKVLQSSHSDFREPNFNNQAFVQQR